MQKYLYLKKEKTLFDEMLGNPIRLFMKFFQTTKSKRVEGCRCTLERSLYHTTVPRKIDKIMWLRVFTRIIIYYWGRNNILLVCNGEIREKMYKKRPSTQIVLFYRNAMISSNNVSTFGCDFFTYIDT